jgi:hypothetical protein
VFSSSTTPSTSPALQKRGVGGQAGAAHRYRTVLARSVVIKREAAILPPEAAGVLRRAGLRVELAQKLL